MHIIRAPSYNPPAFDDEQPPPPMETPPPQYDSIASPTTGLADYFSRLSDAYSTADTDTEDDDEGDGVATPTNRRSVLLDQSVHTEQSSVIAEPPTAVTPPAVGQSPVTTTSDTTGN
jgi:hypothetical protein